MIGGWTEPQNTRAYFGALLLGVYDDDALTYVGHVGTGFNERELAKVMALLRKLERKTSPFARPLKSNERPHWVKPAARRAGEVHRMDVGCPLAASRLPRAPR